MDELQKQINQLKKELASLKDKLGEGAQLEEKIRDIVMFDVDNSTATTRIISLTGGIEDITVPANPTKFVRVYFRGQVYNLALYAIV